jgi:starch synthase
LTLQSTPLDQKRINVLFLAAEVDPWMKVGGLGDVAYSLPSALRSLQNTYPNYPSLDVRLVLPNHAAIREKIKNLDLVANFSIPTINGPVLAEAYYTELNGIPVYLIAGDPIPPDGTVYSSDNRADGKKFFFFSLASLELAKKLNWTPDIVHGNDWHTSLAIYDLGRKKRINDPFYAYTKSVLTIHNLPFMGSGTEKELSAYNIPPSADTRIPEWARYSPLPLGLLSADKIIAVSPTYAMEIQTPEFGCGLQEFIKSRGSSVSGIINGLDTKTWDPFTDQAIPQNFSLNDISNRKNNKQALIKEFLLDPDENIPLFIMIGRFDQQKGIDLAFDSLREISNLPWQAIFLGTGYSKLEEDAQKLQKDFPEKVRVALRFDSQLSHRMYAGGDILLMPSRYEPCGLAQMIAMRYGCVPVARETGGLLDTICDADADPQGTGFLFERISYKALAATLKRAVSHFQNPIDWAEIQKRGMSQDFSWNKSALDYADLYQSLLES